MLFLIAIIATLEALEIVVVLKYLHLQTYLMAAYITSSSVIRLTTIRKCKTIIRLRFHLKTNQSKFLTVPLIHKPILKCPWFYATKLVTAFYHVFRSFYPLS